MLFDGSTVLPRKYVAPLRYEFVGMPAALLLSHTPLELILGAQFNTSEQHFFQ